LFLSGDLSSGLGSTLFCDFLTFCDIGFSDGFVLNLLVSESLSDSVLLILGGSSSISLFNDSLHSTHGSFLTLESLFLDSGNFFSLFLFNSGLFDFSLYDESSRLSLDSVLKVHFLLCLLGELFLDQG